MMIKGSIQEEDIILNNIYAPNNGGLIYIKQIQKYKKGEVNSYIIIVGEFNTPTDISGKIIQTENQKGN